MNEQFKSIGFAVALLLLIGVSLPLQANPVAEPEISCPAVEFTRFVEFFADDVAVQRAHTKVPLQMTALVDADPEPRPETRWLALSQIQFPLMPGVAEQRQQQLLQHIDTRRRNMRSVQLSGADKGYLVKYQFEYRANCWMLIGVDDRSL